MSAGRRPTHEEMVGFARPMVRQEMDWQEIQWEVLNHFAGLTNNDECYELIMDAIRECEHEIEEEAWNAMPPH